MSVQLCHDRRNGSPGWRLRGRGSSWLGAINNKAVERELTVAGCQKLGVLAIGGSTWALPDGTTLDVVISDAPWARAAIASPLQTVDGIPVIALPYLG